MAKNVLVLTTGLSGSSVVTGLIAKAGYWAGDETIFKNNSTGYYETFENRRLVELNNQLVEDTGFSFDPKAWYNESYREHFERAAGSIAPDEYMDFVATCTLHQPWIWKDPKLWLTLGYWLPLFETRSIKCIVLRREVNQLWVSQVRKRIIYDLKYLKDSETAAQVNLIAYLKSHDIEFMTLNYDSLIRNTSAQLEKINSYLDSNLTLIDWNSIYQRKSSRYLDFLDKIIAVSIYIKNYRQRIL